MKRSLLLPLSLILILFGILSYSFKNDVEVHIANKSEGISDTLDVLNYSINLEMVYLLNKDISGYTELSLVPKLNNINSIPLDLLGMIVDSVFINNIEAPSYSYNDTLIRIMLGAPAGTGDTLSVRIYYHGFPQIDPSGWGGFYFSSDSNYAFNLGVGFQSVPHNFGRVWFPCIDDFIDRATYDCTIKVKDTKMAVCGGTLMNETNNGDGTKTFYWRLHDEIPTYLASVAVGPYVPVSFTFNGMNGNIPVKIYVQTNDTNHAKASFTNLLDILSVYEDNFGPYLWERVGYVAVPFNSGAMEHSTNIAYPIVCIDGTLNYESLLGHELSHQWFGDLVTCATAEDMWINEGWADYCESIYMGGLYGHAAYMANVKSNHFYSINNSHIDDGGYYAIYGIPSSITYGSTVYKNGADIIHTLRYYLGDSLFFSTVKAMISTYKFDHISTDEFSSFITLQSGIDVSDFFNGWIKTSGYPHFAIDSVVYAGTGNDYNVYVRQKLHHRSSFNSSNKIEINFMNAAWQEYSETIEFSGEYGNKLFHLPFTPEISMMDLYEKTSDATTDYFKVIKTNGTHSFSNAFFSMNVLNVPDSAFFRIEHNWVSADPLKQPSSEIFRVSDKRYWKVDGIFPQDFSATGKFNFNRNSSGMENTLLPTIASLDSLVLLYRENTASDWQVVNFVKSGTSTGYLTTSNLKKGEYTFGVGKPNQSGISETEPSKPTLDIFPNPSSDTFNITYKTEGKSAIKIYDASNKLVYSKEVNQKQGQITWSPGKLKQGVFFIYLYSNDKPVASKKAVVSR